MAPQASSTKSATDMARAAINEDDKVPTIDQLDECTNEDIASALNYATTIYVWKIEDAMTTSPTILDPEGGELNEDDVQANLRSWKVISEGTPARMATNANRGWMIETLLLCLNCVKDLEYEML